MTYSFIEWGKSISININLNGIFINFEILLMRECF